MANHGPQAAIRYQFCLDNRGVGRVRTTWNMAAQDAVAAGYAVWVDDVTIKLDSTQGATIERI